MSHARFGSKKANETESHDLKSFYAAVNTLQPPDTS